MKTSGYLIGKGLLGAVFLLFLSCEEPIEQSEFPQNVVHTMGANKYGELGSGVISDEQTPFKILGLNDVVKVDAAIGVSMALTSGGKVFLWGNNQYGQLGVGDTVSNYAHPNLVSSLPQIKKISVGDCISMALDDNGNVWVWGTIFKDDFKEETPLFSSNKPVKTNLENIVDISCGRYHCVAVSSDGNVYTWGRNAVGTLGDGTNTHRPDPQQINGISNIAEVSAGNYHTIAKSKDGTVYSWGYNLHGELGIENYFDGESLVPLLIPTLSDIVDIAAGGHHNLCLQANGTLWAWGENYAGQVGNGGYYSSVWAPTIIPLEKIEAIDACSSSSIAVTEDKTFWAWGTYQYYSYSYGYSGYNEYEPTELNELNNSKVIATGGFHYVVVK